MATEIDWFCDDVLPEGWDGRIYLRSVIENLDWMELTEPLPCGNGLILPGFVYNGASSGIFAKLPILHFPKWKHRIATARHDWRCALAKTRAERLFADQRFKIDTGVGGTRWEQQKGYIGVRIGALFGVGSTAQETVREEYVNP
jgi:hypothetical protein